MTLVEDCLGRYGLSGRDDSNRGVVASVAMDDHEKTERRADSQDNEVILVLRMIRVVEEQAFFVVEGGRSLIEGDRPEARAVRRVLRTR